MNYQDWLNEANNQINNALANCFNDHHLDGWSENHITTQVMKSIESLGLEIDWTDKPQKVRWEGFKLKGKSEASFGDIAVIVKVWITSERYVEGVAFYEAKRQFFDDAWKAKGFSSIKQEQLSRISSITHASNVLLYDVDKEERRAYASSVPTVFVNELASARLAASSGRKLHYYGDLWIKALGSNLLGFHLDFQKESVNGVKRLVHEADRPFVVLNAAVAKNQSLDPELDNSFIDRSLYEKWIKPNEPTPATKPKPRDDGPQGPGM